MAQHAAAAWRDVTRWADPLAAPASERDAVATWMCRMQWIAPAGSRAAVSPGRPRRQSMSPTSLVLALERSAGRELRVAVSTLVT